MNLLAAVEADGCGGMNLFLAAAPHAQVVHGEVACAISRNDLSDMRFLPRAPQLGERPVVLTQVGPGPAVT